MSAPTRREDVPDPLQAIRDDLQRRESETAGRSERDSRREQLTARLVDRFHKLISFVGGLLAPGQYPPGDTFFADLARSLLAFNETLRELDQEYPRYCILQRLRRAAQAGVPALDTAASLLLAEPNAEVEGVADTLRRVQGSHPHEVWSMWLTYILDQLVNSHRPPVEDNVPPDTTREEWRKAELAFGCILFSDESFRILQDAMDQAACLVDDALQCGGHRVLNRPPGRVRDMLARFDPRALHWYGREPPPQRLLQPPPSIEAITEPQTLRRRLDEVWTAANCLQIALDKWADWFVELRQKGDAHPAVALNCEDMAHRAIKVLLAHRPSVEPFGRADEAALLAMLPPVPAWSVRAIDGGGSGCARTDGEPTVSWQEDRAFLDRYYRPPARLQEKALRLRSAAAQVVDLLKSFPMSVFAPAQGDGMTRPEEKSETPGEMLDSLLSRAEARQQADDEARCRARERERLLQERAALRQRLAGMFDQAYAFPNEENQQGRKPCPDGFRRWAERFLELGTVMRECDERVERLRLRERLRAVAARAAPDAMKYACAVLLLASEGQVGPVASALERANGDGTLRRFVLWLPFILDNLWHPFPSPDGLIRTAMSPDGTSLEENQQAELAFAGRPLGLPGVADVTGVEQPQPSVRDTQAVCAEETSRINRLHRLATRCADTVLRLNYLRHFGDGDRHARADLVELQQAVADLPELPLQNDPFCRDDVVDVAGVRATSTHAALLQVARRTWEAAHLTHLADGDATGHQDDTGRPFTRVTFQNVRLAPTEVEWTADVWREVSEQLGGCPSIDTEMVEAALALERNRAVRLLEERFGLVITDTQAIALQPARIVSPPAIQPQPAEDNDDSPRQPAAALQTAAQPSVSRPTMKEPSKEASAAYRLQMATGKPQKELAKLLSEEIGRPVDQGTVSRWIKQVREWLKAGNILPDLTTMRTPKPRPIDPERIDLGERRDGRARHQRGRRNSDPDD